MLSFSYKQKHIIALSDTHGKHRQIVLPQGVDILIHCGDACTDGNKHELQDFFEWFTVQKATDKIFIAGNHDYFVDELYKERFSNILFLQENAVEIDGITIAHFTSPFGIPSDFGKVNILVTHEPPLGIFDKGLGCPFIKQVVEILKPDYHIFGHIHFPTIQQQKIGNTIFCNVAVVF